MAFYLNCNNDSFKINLNDKIYIDKSLIIDDLNGLILTDSRFLCVTRPRRFGKTMTLSMLNAYYSKGCDSKKFFDKFSIAKCETYLEHLNKHNVIWVDMSSLYTDAGDDFLEELTKYVIMDLDEKFPGVLTSDVNSISKAIRTIYTKLGERFIFLIDEWDVVFREKPGSPLCDEYIMLLRSLFKSSDTSLAFELVYLTGILPIKRYSAQSTLNMFEEYNMLYPQKFSEYFGFTESEVRAICEKYDVNFDVMKKWYDGYRLKGADIYNPRSVVKAAESNDFRDYWTSTSALESITNYMNYDNGALKGVITRMLSGEEIPVNASRFENDLTKVNSSDAALTILIHLGYLAYNEDKKTCYIPNYEIIQEFNEALQELNWHEAYNPISNSKKLYEETLKGNLPFINETLDNNHKELASIYNKNKEDILGVVVTISYYVLKDYYYVRKEDTSSTGRADITYTPRDSQHMPIIIELKADATPEIAIEQIKSKDYSDVFSGYKGKILLLGISYDSKTLKHDSKMEYIEL